MRLRSGIDLGYIASSCRIGYLAEWWPGGSVIEVIRGEMTHSLDDVRVRSNSALEELVKCLNVVCLEVSYFLQMLG
jgi:hypothetical protein